MYLKSRRDGFGCGILRAACGWGVAAVLLTVAPGAAIAQTTNPLQDRNTPSGSPLDPYGVNSPATTQAQAALAAQASDAVAAQAAARIAPVDVSGTGRVAGIADEREREQGGRRADGTVRDPRTGEVTASETLTRRPAAPGEFERFVERTMGRPLRRFGADLLVPGARDFASAPTATVPSSYILQPGDRVLIGLTGSVDGQIESEIDTNGRIFIPRVGAVRLAGVPYGGLREAISRAVSAQYRDFRVTASVTRLRGLRIYVTGYANNPGAYTVSSLSTLVNALLAAGGPSAGGSFRSVQLFRNGRLVETFDLYDFLRRGDKSRDAVLQNEDVLYVPAVGPQVAVSGSVNDEAIYEARPGESLGAVLDYAGGASALADKGRVILYRLANQDSVGGVEVASAQLPVTPVEGGDIVQVLATGTLARALERQSAVVRVEGEVNRPGNYYVPPGTSLDAVLAMAGGTTARAFLYGTQLQRLSVRLQQRESFREAIQQFEISLAAGPLTTDTSLDPALRAQQLVAARAVLDRLRLVEPDGRVVMDLQPAATALPGTLALENSDRLFIPSRPTTVGVFGAVYRPASFLVEGARPMRVRDYLDRAGGALRSGDMGQVFVVRASGEVVSRKRGAMRSYVNPGDVIFVPVRTQASSVLTRILQFSSILFQAGLTAATVVAVSN